MKVNVLLNYSNLSEDFFDKLEKEYVEKYENIINTILQIPDEQLCWNNLIQPLIDLDSESLMGAYLDMKDFYKNDKIREKASEVSVKLSKWAIEQSMRKDVYLKDLHYYNNQYQTEKNNLTNEQISFIEDSMLSYKMKGLELEETKFERLKEIKKRISELCSEFSQNLNNEKYVEYVSIDMLNGLSESFINERKNDNNAIKITLKYPDIIPIMEYCKNREYRKHISILFKSRCMEANTLLLEETLKLRNEISILFGFNNYSDYRLQENMANTTEIVNNFLLDLVNQVKPILRTDLEELLKLALNDGINKLELYDISYYSRQYTEKTCDFNKEELKQYFPIEHVINGTFDIYQRLLGFKFNKIENMNETFWDESIELYQVNDKLTEEIVGYFYLDLYPREGKYGHAACFPFITKSSRTLPVATMACNFGKGTMTFDEVETFFHEFGHVMHHLSSESTIKDTSSFSCEHDFVETPSQMFEEWCYSEETLKMLAKDIPNEMINKLNKSRTLLQGYHYARQLVFGHYDMYIHSEEYIKNNYTAKQIFDKYQNEILQMDAMEEVSEAATFGHIMGGYDAGYYGYLWSLVYAKDLFSMFKEKGLLNEELGMKLRKEVLSKGSMRKSMESIKIFLGRTPSNEEFIKSIC